MKLFFFSIILFSIISSKIVDFDIITKDISRIDLIIEGDIFLNILNITFCDNSYKNCYNYGNYTFDNNIIHLKTKQTQFLRIFFEINSISGEKKKIIEKQISTEKVYSQGSVIIKNERNVNVNFIITISFLAIIGFFIGVLVYFKLVMGKEIKVDNKYEFEEL